MEVLNTDTRNDYWAEADVAFGRAVTVEKGDIVDSTDDFVVTSDGNVYPTSRVRVVDAAPLPLTPVERAEQYFRESGGVVVSQTADAQRWQIPGTDSFMPAVEARDLSLRVRSELGSLAL